MPCQIAAAKHRVRRRQARNAKCCAGVKAHTLGQGHGLSRRQGDILSRSAMGALPLAVPDPDPLADARGVNTVADRLNHAGAVGVGDDSIKGGLGHAGSRAGAGLGI